MPGGLPSTIDFAFIPEEVGSSQFIFPCGLGLLDFVGYPCGEFQFPVPHGHGVRFGGHYMLCQYMEILARRRRNRLRQDPAFRSLSRKYAEKEMEVVENRKKGVEMRMYSVLLVEI